jgi:hypothetical protein
MRHLILFLLLVDVVMEMAGASSVEVGSQGSGSAGSESIFHRSCTLKASEAGSPVTCLSAEDVPSGKKAYLGYWYANVSGSTAWTDVTTCTLEDTAGLDLIGFPIAILSANNFIGPVSPTLTRHPPITNSTGTGDGEGIRIGCQSNGNGSDLIVAISGVIR